MTRRLSSGCLSDLALDRWLSGELTAREQRSAEAHVQSCEGCRARHAELRAAQRDFVQDVPAFGALGRAGASPEHSERAAPGGPSRPGAGLRSSALWLSAAATLAAAAALLLVVGAPWRTSPRASDAVGELETRTKGGPTRFGWVVRRGQRVFEGRPDQPLRAGDALRFSVRVREPAFVAILGHDAHETSVYYPDGEVLVRVEAGHGELLSAAIELDAKLDEQQLIAVFCSTPVPVARVRDAVERSLDALVLPDGCSSERRTLLKEPP